MNKTEGLGFVENVFEVLSVGFQGFFDVFAEFERRADQFKSENQDDVCVNDWVAKTEQVFHEVLDEVDQPAVRRVWDGV